MKKKNLFICFISTICILSGSTSVFAKENSANHKVIAAPTIATSMHAQKWNSNVSKALQNQAPKNIEVAPVVETEPIVSAKDVVPTPKHCPNNHENCDGSHTPLNNPNNDETPCVNAHENCDGNHPHENGTGMHQGKGNGTGNGKRDGSGPRRIHQ